MSGDYREMSVVVGTDTINYLVWDDTLPDPSRLDLHALLDYLDVTERVKSLRSMPYDEYLETPHWQFTRRAALARAGRRCERCPAVTLLQVHHLTYERRGCEDDADLVVLCRECHKAEHGIEDSA